MMSNNFFMNLQCSEFMSHYTVQEHKIFDEFMPPQLFPESLRNFHASSQPPKWLTDSILCKLELC